MWEKRYCSVFGTVPVLGLFNSPVFGIAIALTPEQQRRDAEVQASSIHQPTAAGGRAALQSIRNLEQQALRNTGQLDVARVHEEGAGARARLMEVGTNDRFAQSQGLAQQRFGLERTSTGFQNRGAQRLENAQLALENAKTPQAVRSARERLLALEGKAPQSEWAVQVTPTTKNADGSPTQGSIYRYNKATGDVNEVDAPKSQAAKAVPGEGSMVRGPDGRTYVVKNGRPVPMGS